jgi:UDP-N-acetylglucosamine transferase subunit ALG13
MNTSNSDEKLRRHKARQATQLAVSQYCEALANEDEDLIAALRSMYPQLENAFNQLEGIST